MEAAHLEGDTSSCTPVKFVGGHLKHCCPSMLGPGRSRSYARGTRQGERGHWGVFALAFLMRSWLSVVYLLQRELFLLVVINAWRGLAWLKWGIGGGVSKEWECGCHAWLALSASSDPNQNCVDDETCLTCAKLFPTELEFTQDNWWQPQLISVVFDHVGVGQYKFGVSNNYSVNNRLDSM